MSLFGNLFSAGSHSVALIDVASGSVGGAYLSLGKEGPAIEYSVRVPVVIRDKEELAFAMLRALGEVNEQMTKLGAPALRRATGTGSIGEVLVSIASPWQDTLVHTERIDESKEFTFTRALMKDVVRRTTTPKPDRVSSGESVIATMLNGYETNQPFGREVKRADIVILSSTIDKSVYESVQTALRKSYHTHHITFAAFAPAAYAVFRDVYPHEKDYLVVDVSGEATDIAFIKQGLLASVISVPIGMNNLLRSIGRNTTMTADMEEPKAKGGVHVFRNVAGSDAGKDTARVEWVAEILEGLKSFSEEHALPRTIFLLAADNVRDYLRRALDDTALRSLWLSSEPLSIQPVLPSHFLSFVKVGAAGTADAPLMLLALYHGKHIDNLGA
jgi:hypothetical protein